MFRQVRMNKWRDGAPRERIQEALAALSKIPSQVPEVSGWFQSETVACDGGDDFDLVLVVDFDDEQAFERYLHHPAHLRVVNELVKPLLERTVRIRCELDGKAAVSAGVRTGR